MAILDQPLIAAVCGVFLLIAGGQLVVREAATLAARLGISSLVIGVVVIGFGTSAPELATGVRAALADAPALAFGNAIGSSLANLLIVLPLAALLLPVKVSRSAIRAEAAAVLVAATLFSILAFVPGMARPGGFIMLVLLSGWLAFSLMRQASGRAPPAETGLQQREGESLVLSAQPWWRALALLVVGIVALLAGADLLVSAATRFALRMGIGEDVLGLTLLSFGTCMPELATALIAAKRRQTDIVVGSVLGSCMFNLLAVAGTVQAISGVGPGGLARQYDVPMLMLATMVVTVPLYIRQKLDRPTAVLLLAIYGLWLAARLTG